MKSILPVLAAALAVLRTAFAADRVAEITFDQEPRENGLAFLREHCQPEQVEVNGQKVWAWKFWAGSYPNSLWVHDVRFIFTDPAFKNGKMPIIRGEIEYLHTSDTSFEAFLDTADGVRQKGGIWGASKEFRTLKFTCDNAFFGARGTVESGGAFDIQAKACNSPIFIRRIRIVGVDRTNAPDFSKLLRVTDVSAPGRSVLYFFQGDEIKLVNTLYNHALVPFRGRARLTLETITGEVLAERKCAVTVPPEGEAKLDFAASAAKLPKAVYYTRVELTENGADKPCVVREGSLALGSRTKLRAAEEGEFKFGLDLCFGYHREHPELLTWARLMGVNIIRYGVDRGNEARYIEDILALRRLGIEVVAITDGSKNPDHDKFLAEQAEVEAFLRRMAEKARPPFWELGNEPDLPFFFPAGIPRYLEGMNRMYDAIKAVDPKARVMNGGIANAPHLPISPANTRKFYELLDPSKLDYVAYHAHGRGWEAEERSHRRMLENAAATGKEGLDYTDTETGVFVLGRDSELIQASTCVQKFAYTMSQRHPFMLWFRLYFKEEEGYGNLESYREPRPVVLAYRTMVEKLRDFEFDARLDAGNNAVKALLFRERKDGRRRVALCWSEKPELRHLSLGRTGGFTAAAASDLFGNAAPSEIADGRLYTRLAFTPVYLEWTAGDGNETADARLGAPAAAAASGSLALGETAIDNYFVTQPDGSKYWKGDADLSARVTAAKSADAVTVTAAVRDARHVAPGAALGPNGDFIEIVDARQRSFKAGLADDGKSLVSGPGVRATVTRAEQDGVTRYVLTLPADASAPAKVIVHDDDWGVAKQAAAGQLGW